MTDLAAQADALSAVPAAPSEEDADWMLLRGNVNPRGPKALVAAAKQVLKPTGIWATKPGECQRFVRTMLGLPGGAGSAFAAWQAVPKAEKHGFWLPPLGVPVFWSGGSEGYGHSALSNGLGQVFSTDIEGNCTVALVPMGLIAERWGLHYLGWAETDNKVRVFTPGPIPTGVAS